MDACTGLNVLTGSPCAFVATWAGFLMRLSHEALLCRDPVELISD